MGRGNCRTCTEGDGNRPALLLRVVARPWQHPASLEHPVGLEHPIRIHLGASCWPRASQPHLPRASCWPRASHPRSPWSIPLALEHPIPLEHPTHLRHPIHFESSHQPGSTPVSWEHPTQPWQPGSACAHPCRPPRSRTPRHPCHKPPAHCPSGQRHPYPPRIPASPPSIAEQAPEGIGLQGEGCPPHLLPASLGMLEGRL